MNIRDEKFKKLILQAEIAALLHDIGKFGVEFLRSGVEEGNPTKAHTTNFIKKYKQISAIIFNHDLPEEFFRHPIEGKLQFLKKIIDFVKLHHAKSLDDFKNYYKSDEIDNFLFLHYLLMMSDTTDSSASKGGSAFYKRKGVDRDLRFDGKYLKQNKDNIYLSTPFGGKYCEIKFDLLEKNQQHFLSQLETILEKLYEFQQVSELIERRNELLKLFYEKCSSVLAETRLPTNDVSLFHHSYAVASIFKAMLARHLLLDEYTAWDENKGLAYYKESLAYLGICWNEEELLARSYRPAEIVGRRRRLDNALRKIKNYLETELCLGNEIYRDRNGIYFLVPSLIEDKAIRSQVTSLICEYAEQTLNSENSFFGDLNWTVLRRDIGISLLELAKIIFQEDGNHIIGSGPKKPLWLTLWTDKQSQEICPHCGLRPRDLQEVSSGSEQDKQCEQCIDLARYGGDLRHLLKVPNATLHSQALRLFGIKEGASYWTFDINKLVKQDEEGGRIALISGFFNLLPFLTGEAFSSILVARPENFKKDPGKDDKSRKCNSWEEMLKAVHISWQNISSGSYQEADIHTLQQILQDSFYANKGDGRVPGSSELEKAQNYINNIVLKAPYSSHLESDAAKIANYALRLHPSPSRLSWVWDTTREFMQYMMNWGETNEVKFIPLTMDSGSAMFLMRADENLWKCCSDIYNEYCRRFARVRHLLPFHLSVTIFYHKSPLYVAIDAARRFRRLAMQMGEQCWSVEKKIPGKEQAGVEKTSEEAKKYILHLKDHRNRNVKWHIPALLPNGKEDTFYTWFWVKGNNKHPVHVSNLEKGDEIYVSPSTFDYEILDTTTRRYDIRLSDNYSRPHLFCGHTGPRPYPLSVWEKWNNIEDVLRRVEESQIKHLVEQIAYIHENWKGEDQIQKEMCEDIVNVIFKEKADRKIRKQLINMAMDGSLFDLIEWQDFICKMRKK